MRQKYAGDGEERTVMPKDLCSWMIAVFGLPGPPGDCASIIQPTASSPTTSALWPSAGRSPRRWRLLLLRARPGDGVGLCGFRGHGIFLWAGRWLGCTMARKLGWVEARGHGTWRWGRARARPPASLPRGAPEGVDYLMAVQCAALAEALATFTPNASGYTGGYRALANGRIAPGRTSGRLRQAGSWAAVKAGNIGPAAGFSSAMRTRVERGQVERLMYLHRSSYNVCDTLAGLPEYIVIGG